MPIPSRTAVLVCATAFFIFCAARTGFKIYSRTASNTPLTCDHPVCDFGTRSASESVEHVFVLGNAGTSVLEIAQARSGCSCATVELGRRVIEPGGSVPLKVTISLDNLRGPVEQHIVVELTDPSRGLLLLRVKGEAESAFDVRPRTIDFGNVARGKPLHGHIDIVSTVDGPFALTSVVCESPLCSTSQQAVADGRSYRVSVHMTGELPTGFWKTALRIRTNNPKEPQITVPVVARVGAGTPALTGK